MDSEPSVPGELRAGARRNRWPLLILTAMAVLFFARFLRTDTIFLMRDLFQKHYPLHIYSREILRHGSLPLWNPYTGCGEPFLANIESAVLYPPNLLYLLLPVTLATAALVIFHTWLTAVAGYALCRVWQVSRLGSLLAATMLSFNTYWLTRIEFLPAHAAIAWFPVVLLLYALWARSRRARWIVLAGLAAGMQMLAGHPESALFPLGAVALYAGMLGLWEARERKRWRAFLPPVAAFAAMCALAVLLAMAQILPTWELVRASSVHSGVVDPELGKASVNPRLLATLLMPFVYGVPGYFGRYWAWPQLSCFEYWCGSFYVGLVAVVVLVGALLMRIAARKGAPERPDIPPAWLRVRMPFLLALLCGSTLYAMGRYTPFFRLCWHALPFLQKFRWPSKSMIGAVFALSVLAGLALDYLSETPERTDRDGRRLQRMLAQWWTFSLFVLGAAFVGVCLADGGRVGRLVLEKFFNLGSLQRYEVHRIPWTALGRDAAKLTLLALVAPVLVLLWSSRNRLRTAAGWLLVGLAYADLFVTGWTLLPSGSADLLVRRATNISVQQEPGLARVFKVQAPGQFTYGETDENVFRWARDGLLMSWPIADHVFAVNAEGNFKLPGAIYLSSYCSKSDNPVELQSRLWRMSNTDRLAFYSNADRPAAFSSLLDYYAVGTALEPPRIEPLAEAMPRAYVVGGPWMLAAERSRFDGITNGDFSFWEAALVERSGPWAKEFSDLKPGRVEQKVTVEYGADLNSLTIKLWSEREALLVVTDAWYPGWRATVNGRAAPVAEVNAFQRGVRVPAGKSTVVMRYEPWTVRVGIVVSLAALIAAVAWLVFNRSSPKPQAR